MILIQEDNTVIKKRTGFFIPVLSLIAISLYNCHGVMLWLLSEMQSNVRFVETLLSPFPFTISKLVLAVPVPLMVDMTISGGVQSRWMTLLI